MEGPVDERLAFVNNLLSVSAGERNIDGVIVFISDYDGVVQIVTQPHHVAVDSKVLLRRVILMHVDDFHFSISFRKRDCLWCRIERIIHLGCILFSRANQVLFSSAHKRPHVPQKTSSAYPIPWSAPSALRGLVLANLENPSARSLYYAHSSSAVRALRRCQWCHRLPM